LIGETLSPFPTDLVVATKGGLTRQGPDRWSPDGRPDYLAKEVEKSLRLLKTDVIDASIRKSLSNNRSSQS
jgi:pyridoxine 4-dehydrogenase